MDQQTSFINQLGSLRSSATFLSIKSYTNDSGETADYNIVFNIDYAAALKRSITTLEDLDFEWGSLEAMAKEELINSFKKSLANPKKDGDPAYQYFANDQKLPIKGIKRHIKSGTLHLHGRVNWKRVITAGVYPKVKSSDLTVAKNKLSSLTSCGKFVQFKLLSSQLDSITTDKTILLPPE